MTDLEKAWHPWNGRYRLARAFESPMGELNALFPSRPQGGQEGTLGDLAHQAEGTGSDHNPNAAGVVRAWDIQVVDAPFDGQLLANYLQHLMATNFKAFGTQGYVIFNRRITAWSPWAQWTTYYGDDPHTGHIHCSLGQLPTEYDNMAPWNLAAAFPKKPVPKPAPKPVTKPVPPVAKEDDDLKYVRFPNAKTGGAIYSWNGDYLLWLTLTDYAALGRPQSFAIEDHLDSNIYACPIVPGTKDPRV